MDHDQLIQLGRLAVCLAVKTYDPSRSAFSTWLGWNVRGVLRNSARTLHSMLKREADEDGETFDLIDRQSSAEYQSQESLADLRDQLEAVRRIISEPPKAERNALKQKLSGPGVGSLFFSTVPSRWCDAALVSAGNGRVMNMQCGGRPLTRWTSERLLNAQTMSWVGGFAGMESAPAANFPAQPDPC